MRITFIGIGLIVAAVMGYVLRGHNLRNMHLESAGNAYQRGFRDGQVDALWNLADADGVYLGPLETKSGMVVSNCVFITLPAPVLAMDFGTNNVSNLTVRDCNFWMGTKDYFAR